MIKTDNTAGFGNSYIKQTTPAGSQTAYSVQGVGAGNTPNGICVGPDNNLWVANSSGILKCTTSGTLTAYDTTYANVGNSVNICSGPDGNLWFCSSGTGGNQVVRMTTSGTVNSWSNGSSSANGICSGPDGNLWYTGYSSGSVGRGINKITPSGTITNYGVSGQTWTAAGGCNTIAVGGDNNIWGVGSTGTNNSGTVLKSTTSGGITTYSVSARYLTISAGPDGNLWVGGNNNTYSMFQITTSGTVTQFGGSIGYISAIGQGP